VAGSALCVPVLLRCVDIPARISGLLVIFATM
jgi:hypothetical protein